MATQDDFFKIVKKLEKFMKNGTDVSKKICFEACIY